MRNGIENLEKKTHKRTNGHTKSETEVPENERSDDSLVSSTNGKETDDEHEKRMYELYSETLTGLLAYVNQGKDDRVQQILAKMPQPWRNMAKTRVTVQKLFNAIDSDVDRLEDWGDDSGNPWFCLSERAYKALEIGFARKATNKEQKQIKKGNYSGQWIRFQMSLNGGRLNWVTIVPNEPDSSVAKALFYSLHELRIACRETAQEYKKKQ